MTAPGIAGSGKIRSTSGDSGNSGSLGVDSLAPGCPGYAPDELAHQLARHDLGGEPLRLLDYQLDR